MDNHPGNILTMLVGLPRSGKTTWAMARSDRCGAPIVCPDAVRLAMHGRVYIEEAEPLVWNIALYMVRALFIAGHHEVILDATNLTKKSRAQWKYREWNRRYTVLTTSKDECIARARATYREDIIPIIEQMADGYEPLSPEDQDE